MGNKLTDCQDKIDYAKITKKEKRRSITIINEERAEYIVTRVDGCWVKQELAADFIITRADCGDLIVELKGTCVEHAFKQVRATAKRWSDKGLRCRGMSAIIICQEQPGITTKKQNVLNEFTKKHKGRLHIVSRNMAFRFDDLFTYGSSK